MSSRRAGRLADRARRALVAVAAVLVSVTTVAHAQGSAAPAEAQRAEAVARAELLAARADVEAARRALDSVRVSTIARADRALDVGGVRLRWAGGSFDDADQARIVDGIHRALASLEARYGAAGPELLRGFDLEVFAPSRQQQRRPDVRIVATAPGEGAGPGRTLPAPANRDVVRAYLLDAAGERARRAHPALRTYPYSMLSVDIRGTLAARAGRELAYGSSAPGRHCLAGSLGACRDLLTDATGSRAKELWYDDVDAQDYVYATRNYVIRRDTAAATAGRKACLEDGDLAACRTVMALTAARYPYTALVRGSFIAHAFELGGAGGLERWAEDTLAGTGAPPITALARIAGVSEDSLVASWQRATKRAQRRERRGTVPFAAAAMAWCGLFLLGATLRRPS